jgi:hypothetical protein
MIEKTIPRPVVELPQLNPGIAQWFNNRQKRLSIVKTTTTPRGQTLDWIPIASQVPSGKIATPPPAPKLPAMSDARIGQVAFELNDEQVERGPAGTVPILRKNLSILRDTRGLNDYLSKRGGLFVNKNRPQPPASNPNPTGFFHVTSGQNTTLYGCEAWLDVWDPYVETGTDHSIMQCGLQNYDNPQLQSLEAGWTVDQSVNGDGAPHLFTYYTTNGYTQNGDNQGGYNTDVDGWVQYDANIYPGAGLNGISVLGGAQLGFSLKFQLWQSNWWFAAQGIWIGYYPASLFMGNQSVFSTLGDHAEWIGFWGEVYSARPDPWTSRTQMGSGQRAEAGWTQACFQRNLRIQTDRAGTMADHNGTATADDSTMYDIVSTMQSGTDWGSYFYGGGSPVGWINNDLTSFANGVPARSGSALDGYWMSDDSQHVNFIDSNGHVHELYIHPGAGWVDNDLTNFTNGTPAAPGSDLTGYWGSDNSQHVNFIDANGHVHELYIHPGAGWVDNDLTSFANGTPARAGSALDGYWGSDNSQHVNFIDGNNHVHELYIHPGAGWVDNDLTNFTNGATAAPGSDINGYWGADNSQHVNFFDSLGRVHELYIYPGASWVDNDLTSFSGGALAIPGSAVDGYWGSDNSQHVNFFDANGHVHELYIHPGANWVDNDLTVWGGLPPAAERSDLDGYWGTDSSQHVNFIDANGHVRELYIVPLNN